MPPHLPDRKQEATILPWPVRWDRPDLALAEGPEARPSIRPGKNPPCKSLVRTAHRCAVVRVPARVAPHDAVRAEAGWVQGVVLYPTGIHEGGVEDAVGTALLRANHPNPFNPQTTISFTLPEACRVELTIYDVAGHLVRTLVQRHMTTGPHSLIWDGRTDGGTRAASGVYFCRLSTPTGTESSTMVMVR